MIVAKQGNSCMEMLLKKSSRKLEQSRLENMVTGRDRKNELESMDLFVRFYDGYIHLPPLGLERGL